MKNYLLILIFSFLSFITFGKTIYTLSKDDFVKQFNDSSSFVKDRTLAGRIYCHNEKGNKVWLSCGENSILIARLNDNNEKKLMLMSIKYRLGEIQAKEYKANEFWIANRKINTKLMK